MASDAQFGAQPEVDADRDPAARLLAGLLRRTHLSTAADLPGVVADEARKIGAVDVALYLVDYEQSVLLPLDDGSGRAREPLSVTGTLAGRAFSSTTMIRAPGEGPAHDRLWVPLVDGTDRLGTMGLSLRQPVEDELLTVCERYAHLVAILLVSKNAYSDVLEVVRRRRPMTIASELVQAVAPPLVFATDGLTVAGLLEPAYDNGGDALDYAENDGQFHFAVFDAMGHGLAAAGVAAFAISAYRFSRRTGLNLSETYATINDAVARQFCDSRFVTAITAHLDRFTGQLTWVCAGHPPPLLLRGGRHARLLELTPSVPLGVLIDEQAQPTVGHEALEPGDQVLLYTDGLTEARG